MELVVISLVSLSTPLWLAFLISAMGKNQPEKYKHARNNVSLELSKNALQPVRMN